MNDAPFDIAFTRKAGKDIKAIEEYLTTHSSMTIASKVVQKLFYVIQGLADQP
ncbi:MAG TPA: hypothetical protein PKE06_08910 [Flavilitoribacter sp.]|nr:hypothetical protein [Flavilitoribacter sp.]HMQ88521.1 hypothetical protein [Flavilitoribacter sp.]